MSNKGKIFAFLSRDPTIVGNYSKLRIVNETIFLALTFAGVKWVIRRGNFGSSL